MQEDIADLHTIAAASRGAVLVEEAVAEAVEVSRVEAQGEGALPEEATVIDSR
jgi:hypothetical protein